MAELKMTEGQAFWGNASALGVMDRGGDVIAPGAFALALASFLSTGFISLGHDWDGLPIAYPTAAFEDGKYLRLKAQFHSTRQAQEARSVILERLEAGLNVGLSVGFRVGITQEFSNGPALLRAHPELDKGSVSAWPERCRLVRTVADLFEVSVVSVPMNSQAGILGLKELAREAIGTQIGTQIGFWRTRIGLAASPSIDLTVNSKMDSKRD